MFALLGLLMTVTPPDAGVDAVFTARALATELGREKFDAAVSRFGPEMASNLTAKVLGQQWQQLTGGLGAFKELGAVREEQDPRGTVVFVECRYERSSLHLKIVLDERLRVIGLRPTSGKTSAEFEAAAREVVKGLQANAWEKVVSRFAPPMVKALPADALARTWQGLVSKSGALQQIEEVRQDSSQLPYTAVDLTCAFEKERLTVRIVLDGNLQVGGLFFKPAWNPPATADRSRFEERPLEVGAAPFKLPGILTLPKGKGPFPAVVLVHGSGPNDADETLGPNKLFRDLAWSLATKGVAVLRYSKRTFEYRGKLSNADIATVKEETIDDALSAVTALTTVKEIDPKRIIVAGHSLGAGLAPRIAAADSRVHGIILLAAPARKLWVLIAEQRKYLASLGPPSEASAASIRTADENAKRLEDPAFKATEIVDGIPGAYWLDLRANDDVAIAAKLTVPMLVLQGERDYQVTMVDFTGWTKALSKRPNVTLKSYAALNHQFMPGAGQSTPAEYDRPNHVAAEVVDDVAKWVLSH